MRLLKQARGIRNLLLLRQLMLLLGPFLVQFERCRLARVVVRHDPIVAILPLLLQCLMLVSRRGFGLAILVDAGP